MQMFVGKATLTTTLDMTEKLEVYDILGTLVPGILTVCVGALCFPSISPNLSSPQFPEAFAVMALIALAFFLGQLIQAISSLTEPWLNHTWGGSLSERVLTNGFGQRYFPPDAAKRIREKLEKTTSTPSSPRSLFLTALHLAETSPNSRVAKFNALYGYHRALLVLVVVSTLLFALSIRWGIGMSWPWQQSVGMFTSAVFVCFLVWHRTKQRAIYYVREVLYTAERLLDNQASRQ